MIHLLLLLLLLACLGIASAWMAENPGSVTIHWFDWRIDTSFAFLLVTAVAAALTLAYGLALLRRLFLLPRQFRQARTIRHYRKGMTELTYSVAALAAADIRGAETHTRKAERLLGRTPLVLLLSAQIARSQGEDGKTRLLLEQMLNHAETEYLAARSLSDMAGKMHMLPRALELAERAQTLNPKEKASLLSVISLHVRLSQWQEAQIAIRKALRRGALTRGELHHYRGIVYLQQGIQLLERRDTEAALAAARATLKQIPYFVPAVLFAAKAMNAAGQKHKASRLITKAWKHSPHPELAEALRAITADEPREAQLKTMKKLTRIHEEPDSTGSSWACESCGQAAPRWLAHCPSCHAFDTLEWKKRELKFAA